MHCRDAQQRLPDLAAGALNDSEREPLLSHIRGGCEACRRELDELTAAAALLAEGTDPVAPRPGLKTELFDKIDAERARPAAPAPTRRAGLRYAAATLVALAAGVMAALLVPPPSDAPPTTAQLTEAQLTEAQSAAAEQAWRQRLAEAEATFGPPEARLATLGAVDPDGGFRATLFVDRLAGQLHVLTHDAPPPSPGRRPWVWLLDAAGEPRMGGPLEHFGGGRAMGLIDLTAPLSEMRQALLTDETPGPHARPEGPELGSARLQAAPAP